MTDDFQASRRHSRGIKRLLAGMSVGIVVLGTMSGGGALVTTRSTVFDSTFDSSPYVLNYGIFNAELKPHVGDTFSEGTQGYFAFNIFDGEVPPEPLPVTTHGSITLTVELPHDLALDRTRHVRDTTPNWCHGTPAELERILWATSCRLTEYSNGASIVQLTVQSRRAITSDDIALLNRVRIGLGVIGKPGIADGSDVVYAGISVRQYGAPGAEDPAMAVPRQTKLADVEYGTSASPRSDLGIHGLDLINERPRPGDRIFQPGDIGRMTFDIVPATGLPVRMRTGESFTVDLTAPRVDDDNLMEFFDYPTFCEDPDAIDGVHVECGSPGSGGGNRFFMRFERTGADTDDAFPGGLSAVLRLTTIWPLNTNVSSVNYTASLDENLEQSGSAVPVASGTVDFWPRRGSASFATRELSVSAGDGAPLAPSSDAVVQFAFLPTDADTDEEVLSVGDEVHVAVELPADLFDEPFLEETDLLGEEAYETPVRDESSKAEPAVEGDEERALVEWDESTGLRVAGFTAERAGGDIQVIVTLVAESNVATDDAHEVMKLNLRTKAEAAGEAMMVTARAFKVGEEEGASEAQISVTVAEFDE